MAIWWILWLFAGTSGECRDLLFTSAGRTGRIQVDGTRLGYFDFDVPGQETWQPGPSFADGRRILFLSMEPRRDGPGRPFDEFYWQTPTHLWIHHLDTGVLTEIANRDRLAPFVTPALLLDDHHLLVQVIRDGVGQVYRMRLDGTQAVPFTRPGEGLPYGFSLAPDGKRVAFHLAGAEGYQVWTSNTFGDERVRLASADGHLYFGTDWSPDGEWVIYADCLSAQDPGHDWADVCISRADGSKQRVLTSGQAMWFAATYGDLQSRGGGSNIPCWTRDGSILYPQRIPGSRVAWAYRVGQPDLDHFNRDYLPEQACGGTYLCQLDPSTGAETALTEAREGVWDFRAVPSPDGRRIAFCRARTGKPPELWVMDRDGSNAIRLTQGHDGRGVDHPRWLPEP